MPAKYIITAFSCKLNDSHSDETPYWATDDAVEAQQKFEELDDLATYGKASRYFKYYDAFVECQEVYLYTWNAVTYELLKFTRILRK